MSDPPPVAAAAAAHHQQQQLFHDEEHAIITIEEAIEEYGIISTTTTEGSYGGGGIGRDSTTVDHDSHHRHRHPHGSTLYNHHHHHHQEFNDETYFPDDDDDDDDDDDEDQDKVEDEEGSRVNLENDHNDDDADGPRPRHHQQLAHEHETGMFVNCDNVGEINGNNNIHQPKQHQPQNHHYTAYDHNCPLPSAVAIAVPAHTEEEMATLEGEISVVGPESKENDDEPYTTAASTATTTITTTPTTTSVVGVKRKEPSSDVVDDVETELSMMNDVLRTANAEEDEGGMGNAETVITSPSLTTRTDPEGRDVTTKTTTPRVRTRVSWEVRMKELADYKAEHGHLLIPIRYKSNPALGKFVHNTREQYKLYNNNNSNRMITTTATGKEDGYKKTKKCSLTVERIDELQKLGFVWHTDRTQRETDEWMEKYTKLVRYKEHHGHCYVPHRYHDAPFAEWIHRQRTTYAGSIIQPTDLSTSSSSPSDEVLLTDLTMKNNPMHQRRIQLLQNLGFHFTVRSNKWMDHYKELKAYKEEHGNCQVPTHYAANPKLGRWVHTQRHMRRRLNNSSAGGKEKKSTGSMTQERIDLLDRLGFSWDVKPISTKPRVSWQERLEELREYNEKYGHFMVDSTDYPELHKWCYDQWIRLRGLDSPVPPGKDASRRMTADRVKALNDIGFTKDSRISETAHLKVGSDTSMDDVAAVE